MPKIAYQNITFRSESLKLLAVIDAITTDYMNRGYVLTVRQTYYQLVAGGHIPNNQKEYNRIVSLISKGRMCGMIDWDAIEDRTRNTRSLSHWDSPADIIQSAADSYAIDKRADQPIYLECWIEKDALIGLLEQTANRYDVPAFSCRGYPSISTLKDAAERMQREHRRDRRIILYAGDHDPTGLDIPRSIAETLHTFGADAEVIRIGLTRQQIDVISAPPAFAKESDKRYAAYVKEHGPQCWELDALDPETLSRLYSGYIEQFTDAALYDAATVREEVGRNELIALYEAWDDITSSQ